MLPPGWYAAVVAVAELAQPWKVYPARVGRVELIVIEQDVAVPVAVQVWLAGAPEPLLALNDRVKVVELSFQTA